MNIYRVWGLGGFLIWGFFFDVVVVVVVVVVVDNTDGLVE